jgi:hypothetical protein
VKKNETFDYLKNDRYISQATCIQITVVGIKNMLVQAVPYLYARNSFLNSILLIIIGGIYLRTFILMKKTISSRFVFLTIFIIVSFLLTILVFPENTGYIVSALPRTLPYCFITCYLLSELRTFEWIEYYMNKCAILTLVVSLISALYIFKIGHITTSSWSSYSMPLSYVTMVSVIWLLYRYFKEEKMIWLILAMMGIVVIVLYGSRNPLLALVAFIIISVLRKILNTATRHKILYLGITLIGSLVLLSWRECLLVVKDVLMRVNISSRTLELLTQDTISTSGRDVIHAELFTALNKHPFTGFGVLGDEVVLSDSSQSAHSLYLSIFSNYGYIIGGMFIVILIYWNLRAYKSASSKKREILIIYMCLVWPRGFTGGDIWSSDVFWWLLGLMLSILAYNHRESLEETKYDKSITCN